MRYDVEAGWLAIVILDCCQDTTVPTIEARELSDNVTAILCII
jgi:hypothetical protein